jgi:DNA uptake protein ComE-like DNA-binding protein
MTPFQPGPPLPPARLRAILGNAVMRQVSLGWRIESQTAGQAVMVTGGEVNHAVHLVLSLVTCGIWLPVWVILGVTGGERRVVITVDPHGVVLFDGRPAPMIYGPAVGPPRRPRVNPNAQAVAAATMRRELRRRARELVAEDPGLARELRVGRPDLPRQYDDGGLIDVNHVPAPSLTALSGVTPEIAGHIVSIRDHVGHFSSAEELVVTADLDPDVIADLREYGIFPP